MHRRLVHIGCWCLLTALCMAGTSSGICAANGMNAPLDPIAGSFVHESDSTLKDNGFGDLLPPVRWLFALYQRGIGPTKGVRCPMYPSCSEYGRRAIAHYGLLRGLLMTADRLHRCGHDLQFYDPLWSPQSGWYSDDPPTPTH
ncbi:MAG: membrane protein insertion efficiency factor YidD [Candidatus Dadabacteria bacterium]|nr:MAG: membrane protein insertion efficiency factor YidD [Candidatus Dadabacteria bacterium]